MFNGSFGSIKQQKLRASIVQRWIDKSLIDKKNNLKKNNFAGVLKVTDERAGSETVSQRYRSVDLDPYQNGPDNYVSIENVVRMSLSWECEHLFVM
jgi:hypothetical protein